MWLALCSLLTMMDVETLWHEFGHFMHSALGRTELRDQHSFALRLDFVEAPSQIMENWVWQDEILTQTARTSPLVKHCPLHLSKSCAPVAIFVLLPLLCGHCIGAKLNLYLHTHYDPRSRWRQYISRKLRASYFGSAVAPYDTTVCTLAHIFAGGYDAGYYGYKWAESIEADYLAVLKLRVFSIRKTGRAYRDLILARGDEVSPKRKLEISLDEIAIAMLCFGATISKIATLSTKKVVLKGAYPYNRKQL